MKIKNKKQALCIIKQTEEYLEKEKIFLRKVKEFIANEETKINILEYIIIAAKDMLKEVK